MTRPDDAPDASGTHHFADLDGGTYERPAFIQVRIAGSMDRYSTRPRGVHPSAALGTGSSVNVQSVGLGRLTGRAARRHRALTSTIVHLTFFDGSPAVHGREEADPVLRPAERAALALL